MKVILLKEVRNVGRKNDIKEVADGYANNFLLAQNLAVRATEQGIADIEKSKAARDAAEAAREQALDTAVRSLDGKKIELTARATPKGGLFKSITAQDIVRYIKEQLGTEVPVSAIVLEPIKTTGDHTAEVRSSNAKTAVTVSITAAG